MNWPSFESAFHAKKPDVAAITNVMNVPHLRQYVFPKLTDVKVTALVTSVLTKGIDYDAVSPKDSELLDVIVDRSFRARKLGIKTSPLSPMGIGTQWLDELEGAFDTHGATAIWRTLRNGKRLGKAPARKPAEGARFLLTPDEVRAASEKIQTIAQDEDELFTSEIAEPFARAAKKKLGLRGTWG